MKTKLILITTALLLFGWDLAQAQFNGGIGRGDSMGRLGDVTDPDPGGPVPHRKVNFWVHSPGYEFDELTAVFYIADGTITVNFAEQNGYWGMDASDLESVCSQTGNLKEEIVLVRNSMRVGVLYTDFCSILDNTANFKAILLVNNTLGNPY